MSFLVPVHRIGGKEGHEFDFVNLTGNTLQKLWVWAGESQIRAIQVWLTDGEYKLFGTKRGTFSEFIFQDGEHITSLSLWANDAGTRLGGIKFKTTLCREFFVRKDLNSECPIDIGSGICVGVQGKQDKDINCLGFVFINMIKSTVMTNVQYPTINDVIPQVSVEELESISYQNETCENQEYTIKTLKTLTKKSSWSTSNKIECTFNMQVNAGIPTVVAVSTGFRFSVGNLSLYDVSNEETKTEKLSFPVKVPSEEIVNVLITIGLAKVNLPYEATVQITCINDSVLEFSTKGTYKGITYTETKAVVKILEIND